MWYYALEIYHSMLIKQKGNILYTKYTIYTININVVFVS